MASFLEALPCESCHNIDLSEKRNKIAAVVSGFFSAVSMFMVNSVSNEQLRGEGFTDGVCSGGIGPKIWFFFAFLMGFG